MKTKNVLVMAAALLIAAALASCGGDGAIPEALQGEWFVPGSKNASNKGWDCTITITPPDTLQALYVNGNNKGAREYKINAVTPATNRDDSLKTAFPIGWILNTSRTTTEFENDTDPMRLDWIFFPNAAKTQIASGKTIYTKKGSASGAAQTAGNGAAQPSGVNAAPRTDFQYDLTQDGKGIVIKKYVGKGGNVVIPDKIEGYPVVEIGGYAFKGYTYFEGASFPIVVPASSSIGKGDKITAVDIPATVARIGFMAFIGCRNLATVTIRGNRVVIDDGAFNNCNNLETLNISDGVSPEPTPGSYMRFGSMGKLPLKTRARLKEMGFQEQ